MKIVRAKALGFCFGVRRAIDMVAEAAAERGPIVRMSQKAAQGLCADAFGVIIYCEEDHPEVPLSDLMAA